MELRYNSVLFDLDGTLVDSRPGIESAMLYALRELGAAEPTKEQLREMLGPPLNYSLRAIFGLDGEAAGKAVRLYRARYRESGLYECALFPGVMEIVRKMRDAGIYMAVATAKPKPFAVEVIKHVGLEPYFALVEGPDVDGGETDKARIVGAAMRGLPGAHLMIGDRRFDIEAANACGIDSAAAMYGYGTLDEITPCGPKYLLNSIDGLRAAIWEE